MLSREIKFIIVKDKAGNIRHYKSDWLHHYTIARDKGYNPGDILEAGMFLEGHLYILECYNQRHLLKQAGHYIGNRLNEYHDLRLANWLRGRELEAGYYYKLPAIYKEGD